MQASKQNTPWYVVLIIAGFTLPVALTWLFVELYYTFYTLNTIMFFTAWGIVIFGFLLAIFMIVKVFMLMKVKPFGDGVVVRGFRTTSVIMIATSLSILLIFGAPTIQKYDIHPHLSYTGDPRTSMTLTWYTVSPYTATVRYGTAPGNLSSVMNEAELASKHVVNFTGLSPATTYYYTIDGFDELWSFTTASGISNQAKFVAISDMHADVFYEHMLGDLVNEDMDFVLGVGDIADFGGWTREWASIMSPSNLGMIATNYSFMTTIGNHDSLIGGLRNYMKFFTMPDNAGTQKYYHFKYNGINFINLHLEWGIDTYTNAQETWLQQTLDSIGNDEWLVVLSHCMHFSSGGFGNATGTSTKLWGTVGDVIGTFHDLFVQHDVDLVISGHDHHFELSVFDEVVYAIVGTASTRLDSRSPVNSTNSVYYEPDKSGFTSISIDGSTCTISANLYENDALLAPYTYSFNK